MSKKIVIQYTGFKLKKSLDKVIKKWAKKKKYKFYSSGINFLTGIRDIIFKK